MKKFRILILALFLLPIGSLTLKGQDIRIPDSVNISTNLPFIDDSGLFPDKHGVYREPEKLPMFPGGNKAYQKYMLSKLKWSKATITNLKGKVFISFIVEKSGMLSHIRLTKKLAPLFDTEVLRAVKGMPRWIPGKCKGKPVRSYYTLAVNFQR